MDSFWFIRNKAVFEDHVTDGYELLATIQARIKEGVRVFSHTTSSITQQGCSILKVRWVPPRAGWMKLNTD